jgi:Mrp family chromosome partitioning ATPase/capsular polysaccharide biosynthesis protein
MKAMSIDQGRFEPTVWGAVRRYRVMVLVVALLTAAAAVGYTLVVTEVYRADATITVPQALLSEGEASDQYLDSQVLLLKSQSVADRAAQIANAELNGNVLSPRDFLGERKSLKVTPPEGANPGSYGASMVAVSFTWPNSKVAQVGANALLQAFDEARVAAITAQGEAAVASIEKAIGDARTKGQIKDLQDQRAQTLVNLELDLARHPTVMWATEPELPINANSKRSGAIALLVGSVVGAGLAYVRATRRRCIEDRRDPAGIYDAPLIGEIPAPWAGPTRSNWTSSADALPMASNPGSQVAETFRFAAGWVERIRAASGNQLVVTFVSANTDSAKTSAVANLALAAAESGTSVLAVDADSSVGRLTNLLLPGGSPAQGFEQVIAGQRSITDCIEISPLSQHLTVLGSGPRATVRTTGAAYSRAVEELFGKAKASYDLVLIDSPAVLRVADAIELVDNSDAAIIVVGAGELVRDHIAMVERLDLVESEVVGYLYWRPRSGSRLARRWGAGGSALPARPEWTTEWTSVPSR